MDMSDTRKKILDEIIEIELKMFLATPNQGGTASCQERPETFRIMRKMAHHAHSDKFLESYLDDLHKAVESGRNFMLEKYARMDDLIPPLQDTPLLDEIADAETAFLENAAASHPDMIKRNDSKIFRTYLRCELETLSPASLAIYAEEIREAIACHRNPVLERHNWLARTLGKPPLQE